MSDLIPPIPQRGFSASEYERRTESAQKLMDRAGLAGILLTTEPEIRYFTGFQTLFWQSPTRPWFVFLPSTGKPIAIIPEIGAALMRQSWIEDIRCWSAPCPDDDGVSLLVDLLSPITEKQHKIGMLKGHETHLRMPLADYEKLCAGLPGVQFQDASPIIRALRMVKSTAEIEKIRYICGIGSQAFENLPKFAKEGALFDGVFREFRREGLRLGADDMPYVVGGRGQGGYIDVISPPRREPLQKNDVFMIDTGAVWDGYYCDFDRNFAIGEADEPSKRAYDVLWSATEAGLEQARIGESCATLFEAMSAVIRELDDQGGDVGRLGHGLGMQLTEYPSHAPFDNTIIQENMVLTLEPSLSYGDGRIMVHEENILITKDGAQLLTKRAAPELPEI